MSTKKLFLEDVRNILTNMGNTYVSTLSNEELSSAILQDDLGLEDYEVTELVEKIEKAGGFFIAEPALRFLKKQRSLPVYLLSRICEDYTVETKPCLS